MKSRKFVISNRNKHQSACNVFVDHESKLTFREKENHSTGNVPCSSFLSHGASILFFAVTCVDFILPLKKNCEIINEDIKILRQI